MMFLEKKIGIITQARTTSTRLPRKVLLSINEKTVLEYHLDRLKLSGYPVFVATTINQTDDDIVKLCDAQTVPCYRGSEHDVLSRFYECAKKFKLDVVVRVTSDCPLIDGGLIKDGVHKFLSSQNSNTYVSNCIARTYPRGFDYEVFSFDSLEKAFINGTETVEREHVTPFIRNVLKNTGVNLIDMKRVPDASQYRLTLDESDDWILIKKLIEEFQADQKNADEIIRILESNVKLSQINAHIEQKKI